MDNVLNGEYKNYGIKWIEWTQLQNTIQYDYLGTRAFPKPGMSCSNLDEVITDARGCLKNFYVLT